MKRIKITKNGKIMTKQTRTGHLKRKMDSSRRFRTKGAEEQTNLGQTRRFKRLLAKMGRNI